MYALIIIFIVLVILAIVFVFISRHDSAKEQFTLENATEMAIIDLYINGHIDFDTYLSYTMGSGEGTKRICDINRYHDYIKGNLFDDSVLAAKIDKDLVESRKKNGVYNN